MKKYLFLLICIVCLAIVSCRSLIDEITPAIVENQVFEYVGEMPPHNFFSRNLVSLAEAKALEDGIVLVHRDAQVEHLRAIEDNEYYHDVALGHIQGSITESEKFQQAVVGSESNPFSLLGLLGIGGLSGFVGKQYFRKPGDFSPEAHETEVQKAKESVRKELNGGK
jgi:hypothetical protein